MSQETRTALGRRIREHREKAGLSQQTLSLMVNVERSYLAKVEAGKRNLTVDCLEKIADGFGLSLEELFKDL